MFWLAFAGFFFGLTYGLLQIVGEMAILRRERLAGLHVTAYVGAKVAVLTPVLLVVAGGMLAVLRALDRLPPAGGGVYAALLVTLTLEALAALALGLLASAAVTDVAQATLALPMLCFPQVLFAGAIVPVPDMAAPGQAMSLGLANRWAFESLGRALDLDRLAPPCPRRRPTRRRSPGARSRGGPCWPASRRCSWPRRSPCCTGGRRPEAPVGFQSACRRPSEHARWWPACSQRWPARSVAVGGRE